MFEDLQELSSRWKPLIGSEQPRVLRDTSHKIADNLGDLGDKSL